METTLSRAGTETRAKHEPLHKNQPGAHPQPPSSAPTEPTPERIMQFAWGYAPTLILESALRHGFFDLIDQKPRNEQELAAEAGVTLRGATGIANALVALGFLVRSSGRYHLTPESAAFLVSGKPGYHGAFFQHTVRQLIPRWLQLPEVVKTGCPAMAVNEEKQGAEFFAEFVESLFPLSYRAAQILGDHLGIPQARSTVSVLDIGAGSGVWGIALAQQSPKVRVLAVDWPEVLRTTHKMAVRFGLAERLQTSAGDLKDADFGAGHQIATIGHILHSEGSERSRDLLKKTFSALAPGGTVAIAEFLPNAERTGPPNALIFAVNMLVNTERGDAFTFEEISEWLRAAGFINPRQLEAPGPSPLILATRP